MHPFLLLERRVLDVLFAQSTFVLAARVEHGGFGDDQIGGGFGAVFGAHGGQGFWRGAMEVDSDGIFVRDIVDRFA